MSLDIYKKFEAIDWDFKDADTQYLTHNFHPYPAKFIPQIPRQLMLLFSNKGDVILDPFCGSGTTLVEARLLGLNSIGVDINPLACLISKVKTTPIPSHKLKIINNLLAKIRSEINLLYGQKLLTSTIKLEYELPRFPRIDYWFKKHVQKELAIIKKHIDMIPDRDLKDMCLVAFSSIIIRVSNQESDTRYAKIDKKIKPFETFTFFENKLRDMIKRIREFSKKYDKNTWIKIFNKDSRDLNFISNESVDLIVTSPPYINAYDYALYHRHRLYWLGFDPKLLRGKEIGAHSKFSKKEKLNVEIENFRKDIELSLRELYRVLKSGKHCCIVVGNTTLWGQEIKTSEIFINVGKKVGFRFIIDKERNIHAQKKKFNPRFGQRRSEHILVFKKD